MENSDYSKGCVQYTFSHYGYRCDIFVAENLDSQDRARRLFAKILSRAITCQVISGSNNVFCIPTFTIKGIPQLFAVVAEKNHIVAVGVDSICDGMEVVRAIASSDPGIDQDSKLHGIDQNYKNN